MIIPDSNIFIDFRKLIFRLATGTGWVYWKEKEESRGIGSPSLVIGILLVG